MFSNPWFIGIAGSILASIIIKFLNNIFGKKDYNLNVKKANSELINLLIMSTAEEKLPNQAVVEALINSTAKKYSVRLNDIHSVNDTYDDLIKAIYETNFVPIDKKQVIANQLSEMRIIEVVDREKEKEKQRPPELFELRRTKLYLYLIFILTLYLFIAYFEEKLNGDFSWASLKDLGFDEIVFFGGMIGLILSFIMNRYLELKIKKRKEKIINDIYNNTHQY